MISNYISKSYVSAIADPALNIYARCRIRQGLSQEAWAERLDVSVDSIRRYEAGIRVPSNATVADMVAVSGDEMLAYQHLLRTSMVLDVLPDIDDEGLQAATIRLINSVLRWTDGRRDRQLLQIAADGVLSPEEEDLFREISGELREIVGAAYQLRYAGSRKEGVGA